MTGVNSSASCLSLDPRSGQSGITAPQVAYLGTLLRARPSAGLGPTEVPVTARWGPRVRDVREGRFRFFSDEYQSWLMGQSLLRAGLHHLYEMSTLSLNSQLSLGQHYSHAKSIRRNCISRLHQHDISPTISRPTQITGFFLSFSVPTYKVPDTLHCHHPTRHRRR